MSTWRHGGARQCSTENSSVKYLLAGDPDRSCGHQIDSDSLTVLSERLRGAVTNLDA